MCDVCQATDDVNYYMSQNFRATTQSWNCWFGLKADHDLLCLDEPAEEDEEGFMVQMPAWEGQFVWTAPELTEEELDDYVRLEQEPVRHIARCNADEVLMTAKHRNMGVEDVLREEPYYTTYFSEIRQEIDELLSY